MKRKKINYHEHDTPRQEDFPNLSDVASANECTGLMYRTPQDQKEWESYQQLSSMAIPREEVPQEKAYRAKGPDDPHRD